MVLVGNIFGQIFCIGLMFVLVSGIIGNVMEQENKALFRVISANIIYCIICILWQLTDGERLAFNEVMHYGINVLICISAAFLGASYYRYLYYVVYKRWSKNILIHGPAILLGIFAVASVETGWFFRINSDNQYVRGDLYIVNLLLSYAYILIFIIMEKTILKKMKIIK